MKSLKLLLPLSLLISSYTLTNAQVVITAIVDGPITGGLPKAAELYATDNIADLSSLGIGVANNGDGTDSVEFSFPAVAVEAGTYIYISSDTTEFENFFGFSPDYVTGGGVTDGIGVNGNDAVELFWNGDVIDIFGDINIDGSGTSWEYTDGWVARKPGTGPDGDVFQQANWNYSGPNALDGVETNASAANPVPLKSYTMMVDPDVTVILQNLIFDPANVTIEVGQTVRFTNVEQFTEHNVNGQQSVFPCNPVGFFSGVAAFGPWDFDVTFNQSGHYNYQCDPHVLNGMVGTVTVVDPDAPAYPAYDIITVTTENIDGVADSLDADVTLTALVYGTNRRPGGLEFAIIDNFGNGITIFESSFNNDCYDPVEGDMIVVSGFIDQFNGLTQLALEGQVEVLSSGNPVMDPLLINEPLSESHESRLVYVESASVNTITATGSSGWNLETSNANGDYLVRLDADVFSEAFAMGLDGKVINVAGIGSQFDGSLPFDEGYQLLPRYEEDIKIVSAVTFLEKDAVFIFPNPVIGYFQIISDIPVTSVELISQNGKLIISEVVAQENAGIMTVFASMLTSGIYLVRVTTPEGVWSGKVIKL